MTTKSAPKKLNRPAVSVAFASRKGGVGKTTITMEMAIALAAEGYSVIVLEIDDRTRLTSLITNRRQRKDGAIQQGQTTYALFTHPEEDAGQLAYRLDIAGVIAKMFKRYEGEVAAGRMREQDLRELRALVTRRQWDHAAVMDFLPGSESIRRVDNELAFAQASQATLDWNPMLQLPRGVDQLRARYDYIIMDTPPSLANVQRNIALAADYVIPVVDFEADSEDDYHVTREFLREARGIARHVSRRSPVIPGVIFNKYDDTFVEMDVALMDRYTKPHIGEEGELEAALIHEPALGVIPMDPRRVKTAQAARIGVALYHPLSAIAEALYLAGQNVREAVAHAEARIGVPTL